MRKNAAHLVIILLTIFLFSGCLGGREINDLEIVIGMGVDKGQDTQDIIITAQVVKEAEVGRTSDESGGGKAYWNVTGNGKSVFDAIRKVTHKTGNRLFVSHSQVVIFGNDLASEGLQEYIDFS